MGLIEHRPGVGTFVLEPPKGRTGGRGAPALKAAAEKVVAPFDGWKARTVPQGLTEAIEELRRALR
jgi:hypothetical protein